MKTALFIKTKNLGDAVILTASIAAIRDRYRIHVLCFKDCESIYTDLQGVERVWPVRRGERGLASVVAGLRLFAGLRKLHFDLLVQFSDDWRGAILSRFLRVDSSIAHRRPNRKGLWERSFSSLVPITPRRHSVEQDLDLLRKAGLYLGDAPPYALPNALKDSPRAGQILTAIGYRRGDFVVVHLFSRWSFKQISDEVCKRLILRLAEEGNNVLVTGDVQDEDKFKRLGLRLLTNVQIVFGESLGTFSSLINYSKALISIDSLAIHLASALERPVLAIFGPSGEDNWRPWRTSHVILENRASYPCRPCGKDGCGGSKVSQCLVTIEENVVMDVFNRSMIK